MTESQWLSPGNLTEHVDFLYARKHRRKLRLFSIACCRQLSRWIDEPRLFDALLRAELFADGELSDSTIGKWRRTVNKLEDERRRKAREWTPQLSVYHYVRTVCLEGQYAGFTDNWRALVYHGGSFGEEVATRGSQLAHDLLLEIFGNPFRPIPFLPEWRTDTAVSLAAQMYESRDFSAMPILADALQDAGCDNEDVLNHCRDANQTHVRGCWVVDHVLGKA